MMEERDRGRGPEIMNCSTYGARTFLGPVTRVKKKKKRRDDEVE